MYQKCEKCIKNRLKRCYQMLSMTSKKLFWVYSQFNDRVTVGSMQNKMQNIPKMRKMHQNRLKIYYQMLSMASKKCGGVTYTSITGL